MSVVSRNEIRGLSPSGSSTRRTELAGLSQDPTNRAIAMGQYRQATSPDLLESLFHSAQELKAAGQYDESLKLLQQLTPSEDSPLLLKGMMLKAEILSLKSDFAAAYKVYDSLQAFAASNLSLSELERQRLQGLIYLNMAWLQEQQNLAPAAVQSYSQAISWLEPLREQLSEQILPSLMMAYRQRSRVQRQFGKIEQALSDLESSLQYQEQLLQVIPGSELENISSWFALGQMQQEVAHWQEALDSFELALKLCSGIAAMGIRRRWTGMIQTQQARCQEELGDPQAAYGLYEQAASQISSAEAPLQWVQLQILKATLLMRLQQPGALDHIGQIHAELQGLEQAGTDRSVLAIPLMALAELCQDANVEQALEFYGATIRCVEQSQHLQAEESLALLVAAYRGRGILLAQTGQLPKALASLKQAQRHAESLPAAARAELELQLGLALQAAGKPDQALIAFSKAIELSEPDAGPASVWFRAAYFQAFVLATDLEQPAAALNALLALDAFSPQQVDYDLACLYTRLQQPDQAFLKLQRHLASLQPLSREEINADPDLLLLQADERWKQLWLSESL